jgi:hypothetical protein
VNVLSEYKASRATAPTSFAGCNPIMATLAVRSAPSRDTLSFITYTSVPEDEARTQVNRDIVRSRAMRSGYVARGKPSLPVEQLQESELIRTQDRKQRIGRFRIKLKKNKPVLKRQQPPSRVIGSRNPPDESIKHFPALDPFVSSLGKDAWHLFHHCNF